MLYTIWVIIKISKWSDEIYFNVWLPLSGRKYWTVYVFCFLTFMTCWKAGYFIATMNAWNHWTCKQEPVFIHWRWYCIYGGIGRVCTIKFLPQKQSIDLIRYCSQLAIWKRQSINKKKSTSRIKRKGIVILG